MAGERLKLLREQMRKYRIDMYLIFLSDDHSSEYVGEHFKEAEFLSGFTGSNATLLITRETAGLWTDGRYFVQAAKEIKGSGFTLFKMGEEDVPGVSDFVKEHLEKGMRLGYDGRHITVKEHRQYELYAKKAKATLDIRRNLVDAIWKERPPVPHEMIWILDGQHAGAAIDEKLAAVRGKMAEAGAKAHLLTSLCDIAWLLNLRGSDIAHVPVFLSFLYITEKRATLYVDKGALGADVKAYLKEHKITVRAYDAVYRDMARVGKVKLLYDPAVTNAALYTCFAARVVRVEQKNPTEGLKCVKNAAEIANTKQAHIEDGAAVTRFIYHVKTNIGKEPMTELTAAAYLKDRRQEIEGYLDDSFDTIAAYGANAAMMHYSATEESFAELKQKGFLLVDSGGHYLSGTTDITRTICLGSVSKEERIAYTRVLRAALRLMAAHFPKGTYSQNLDILARGPLWDEGLDYRCGTGHGVGHILNVHEGPNGFRAKISDAYPLCEMQPGMITTDEPGLYEEDIYGIRIENELLCVEDKKTQYGQFYKFEVLTMAPIDLDAVEASMLTQYEKETLNAYHKKVYETLAPLLSKEEAEWLSKETRAI